MTKPDSPEEEDAPSLSPTDAVACAVGHLVLAAAGFEGALGSALWRIAGERSGVLLSGLSVNLMKQALRTLTQLNAESHLAALKGLLSEADGLDDDRNNVVHGYWFFNVRLADREGRSDVAFRPRRWKTDLQGKRYTAADLTVLTDRYRRLISAFDEWVAEAWPEEGQRPDDGAATSAVADVGA